jgi:hypothetical protein
MSLKEVDGELLLLGKGKVYFDRFDASGNPTGERFLGNTPRFEIETSDDTVEKFSSATADAPRMKEAHIRRGVNVNMDVDEFDVENVALALAGSAGELAVTADSVVDEVVSVVETGRFYPLAQREVSNVVVQDDTDTTTYVAGTDYDVDAVTGRLYIIPGGGISAGDDLHVDYDYATISLPKVSGGSATNIEGRLRFIGDPTTGPKYEAEFWRVTIRPDGVMGLIGDDFASTPLTVRVEDDSVNHPAPDNLYRLLRLA